MFLLLISPATFLCETLIAQESDAGFQSVTSADHFLDEAVAKPGMRHISFDTDESGSEIKQSRDVDVNTMFSFEGARFACMEPDGMVVIPGYKFKESRSRQRAIGTYFVDETSGKKIMYKGPMRIDFCVPGESGHAANVKRAGMFVEIVIPRHTVIEAYNHRGHRVGITWATDNKSSFVGFDSPSGVAWVVVKGNSYLDWETDRVNNDYAVDDLVFDEPEFDPSRSLEPTAVVVTSEGKRLTDGQAVLSTPGLQWYHAPFDPMNSDRPKSGVMAMLTDGSVVNCRLAEGGFELTSAPGVTFPMSDVVGFWGVIRVPMYPNADDLPAPDNVVLVSPMYRVSIRKPVIDFSAGTVQIVLDDATVSGQDEAEAKRLSADHDLLRQMLKSCNLIDLNAARANRILPVWMDDPVERDNGTGVARTRDGIEYVLGGDAGFQLKSVADSGVTVAIGDRSFEVPLEQIESFQMPPKK